MHDCYVFGKKTCISGVIFLRIHKVIGLILKFLAIFTYQLIFGGKEMVDLYPSR